MQTPDRTLTGILCMVAFCVIAPVMDAFAKATPDHIPLAQILFARFSIQIALLIPLAALMRIAHRPSGRETLLHLLRGLALLIATGFFFAAVRQMSIASAVAIFFVEPFILTLMGGLLLGEEVGWRRIMACVVGFGGALLVIQPSFDSLGLVALFPLGTAFFFALYMVLTRTLSVRGHPVTLQAYTATAATLVLLPMLLVADGTGNPLFDPVWPQGFAVITLLGVGLVATVSHLFISFALKYAPATAIAPLQYLEIVAATAVGYVAFGDFPNALTWLGIAIIVASGLYVFAREQRRKGSLPPPAKATGTGTGHLPPP